MSFFPVIDRLLAAWTVECRSVSRTMDVPWGTLSPSGTTLSSG